MIPFFRKLRRRFLDQGRLARYLLYALGEILLVVIGILIALQVDTWSEERRERELERTYLIGIRGDLERNLIELDRVILKSESVGQIADSLLQYCTGVLPGASQRQVESWIFNLPGYTLFMSSEGSFADILGSGRLEVLEDPAIRTAVATWDSGLKGIRAWEEIGEDYMAKLLDYMERNLPMYEMLPGEHRLTPMQIASLCTDMRFKNYLDGRQFINGQLTDQYRVMRKAIEDLLKQVEARLGQLQ